MLVAFCSVVFYNYDLCHNFYKLNNTKTFSPLAVVALGGVPFDKSFPCLSTAATEYFSRHASPCSAFFVPAETALPRSASSALNISSPSCLLRARETGFFLCHRAAAPARVTGSPNIKDESDTETHQQNLPISKASSWCLCASATQLAHTSFKSQFLF